MMEEQIRILVADDEEINRLLLGKLLEQHGFYQESVESGQAALARWRSGEWDLVILDVNMPELGGMDVTRAIRTEEEQAGQESHLPIFALTATADKDEQEACLAAGMDVVLVKPLRIEVLLELVQALLGGRNYSLDELIHVEQDDEDFAHELIRAYIRNEPAYLSNMFEAAQKRDFAELKKAAHKLRGALAVIRANAEVLESVRCLEECGSKADSENLAAYTVRARVALSAFGKRTRQLVQGTPASEG